MKVDTSILQSAYSQRFEKTKVPVKGMASQETRGQQADNGREIDQVDLKSGCSLEKIQQFLTTAIGKKVDKMMADAGIDLSTAAGQDWSPEATSGRIFDMTTGLIGVWRDQHPKMSEADLIDSFEKVLRASTNQGYQEARTMIAASGFGDETADVGSRTMSLLSERYDTYFEGLRNDVTGEPIGSLSGTLLNPTP